MKREVINIVITGVGGQGNILVQNVITTSAVKSGYPVRGAETLGAMQRLGHVISQIRIGPEAYSAFVPRNQADVLLGLEPIEALRVSQYVSPDCLVIINTRGIIPQSVRVGKEEYCKKEEILEYLKRLTKSVYAFDAIDLAIKAGDARAMNIVMIGALAATDRVPLTADVLKETIKEMVPRGTEKANIKAFDLGFEMIKKLIEK